MGKMIDVEKVKTWLCDNFYTSVHNGDYGDYTTLGVGFDNFEEMMADFNKKWRPKIFWKNFFAMPTF